MLISYFVVYAYNFFIFLDSNFEWVGETGDGCLLCVWEEEVLVGGTTDSSSSSDDGKQGPGNTSLPSLATATHLAIASPDLQSVQVSCSLDHKNCLK